jgi:hypothetical protein
MLSPLESWALILSLIGVVVLVARAWERRYAADRPSELAGALDQLRRLHARTGPPDGDPALEGT